MNRLGCCAAGSDGAYDEGCSGGGVAGEEEIWRLFEAEVFEHGGAIVPQESHCEEANVARDFLF